MLIQNIKVKIRLLTHLIFKSGNFIIGVDHFLVAFPSILLMAKILNTNNFDKNSISLLLFSTGISNIILYIVTKLKIPIFVAPSFAFVGFITTTMSIGNNNLQKAHFNVFLGCFFASIVFLLISLLYKSSKIRKYAKFTLPDALVGPLISLIGLDLLDTAIEDSGLKSNDYIAIIISIVTLCIILFSTIFKRHYLKNASIVIGVIGGVIVSCFLGRYHILDTSNRVFSLPNINITPFFKDINIRKVDWLNILVAIIPATIVVFSENITKITLLEKILRADDSFNKHDLAKFYQRSIFGHAISFLSSILMGSVPNTVYAQNIALMEINNVENYNKNKIHKENGNNISKYYNRLSVYPLIITSIIALVCSFFTIFQDILSQIPKPVYGGMELFVFSIISAQGVQLLVDRKVDYKKITNQIITSATLLAGLSGVSINLKVTEINGLSLGLLVGVTLNLTFKLFLHFGLINEKVNVVDIIEECSTIFNESVIKKVQPDIIKSEILKEYLKGENRTDYVSNLVCNIISVEIITLKNINIILSKEESGNIIIETTPYLEKYIELINDYPKNIKKQNNSLLITFDEKFSMHKMKNVLHRI